MKIEQPTTLTIDGKSFAVADFSDKVKNLIAIRTEWQNDLVKERLMVAKSEAALRGVDAELAQLVSEELKAKEEPAAPAAEEKAE